MKKILLPVLTTMIACTCFAQDPVEPCCAVVGINTAKNIVVARNTTTGRLFAFKVDAMDVKAIKLNDAITANSQLNTVTAINGVARKYQSEPINDIKKNVSAAVNTVKVTTAEPVNGIQLDGVEPCCSIVQIDNAEPCCAVVTAKNKATGATMEFKAPALVLQPVKVGDPVYLEPCCNMAIVQSSYQSNNGQLNSFGYPIQSGDNNNSFESNTKWVISTVNMKGVLGRLNTAFPADVEWSVDIRNASDNKFITNRSGFSKHGPAQDIAPGTYHFQLNTITVENVPIERGKETRLKTGVLQIVSEGDWEIYNETKQKFHTSGNKPKKIALPIGSYQLKLGGQFYPVVVKDKETVEY